MAKLTLEAKPCADTRSQRSWPPFSPPRRLHHDFELERQARTELERQADTAELSLNALGAELERERAQRGGAEAQLRAMAMDFERERAAREEAEARCAHAETERATVAGRLERLQRRAKEGDARTAEHGEELGRAKDGHRRHAWRWRTGSPARLCALSGRCGASLWGRRSTTQRGASRASSAAGGGCAVIMRARLRCAHIFSR